MSPGWIILSHWLFNIFSGGVLSRGLEYVIQNTPGPLPSIHPHVPSLDLLGPDLQMFLLCNKLSSNGHCSIYSNLRLLLFHCKGDDQVYHPKKCLLGSISFTAVFLALPWAELDYSYCSFSARRLIASLFIPKSAQSFSSCHLILWDPCPCHMAIDVSQGSGASVTMVSDMGVWSACFCNLLCFWALLMPDPRCIISFL